MALPKFYKVCQDQQGNLVPQVLCNVFNHGTALLASLYQDDAGLVPLANPMTSDAQYGSIKFYVNPGHYDLTFTKPGYTFEPIYDMQVPADTVTLGSMSMQNANTVDITGGSIQNAAIAGGTINNVSEVGIALADAAYPLDVGGAARVAGDVAFGTNFSPFTAARVHMEFPKATRAALSFRPTDNDTGGAAAVLFLNFGAATTVGSIATTATATSFNTSSDGRLKQAVETLTGALDVVRALRPVAFRWTLDDTPGVGFVAQEVAQVVDGVVRGAPDAVDAQGQIVPMGMDASKLVPWLVGAVQDLAAQVAALTARREAAGG